MASMLVAIAARSTRRLLWQSPLQLARPSSAARGLLHITARAAPAVPHDSPSDSGHAHRFENRILVLATGAAAVLLASGLPTSGGASLCDADTGRDPEPEPDAPGVPISNAHTAQWRIYTDKGAALVGEGKLAEGEAFMRRALEEARMGFGDDTPHVAAAMSNLAECLRLQGRLKEAEPMCEQAVSILEKAFGLRDPRVANAYQNLVTFYVLGGDIPKAQATAEKALNIFHQALGKNHPIVARSMWGLASLLSRQGKQKDALALRLESMELMEGNGELLLASSMWRVLQVLNELAVARRFKEADLLLARYRRGMEDQVSPESREAATLTSFRAHLCRMMGQLEEAERCHESALGVYRHCLTQRGRGVSLRRREQLSALCVDSLMYMTELQREMGTEASLERARSTAEEAVAMARTMWRDGVAPQSGFSIGSWSFSWAPFKGSSKRSSTEERSRFGAYHLAASLRVLAELRLAEGATEAAGELLLEAYLAITTTAALKREARKAARGYVWPPTETPIPASTPPPESSEYESLLVMELDRCVAAIRPLAANIAQQADPPAKTELLRNLQDVLRLEDDTP